MESGISNSSFESTLDLDEKPVNAISAEEAEMEGPARKIDAVANCCKKTMRMVTSHIGLCGMVVVYTICGGFMFQHLEQANEKSDCFKSRNHYKPLENATKHNLWQIATYFHSDEDMAVALEEFQKELVKFRTDVLLINYDGKDCSNLGIPGGPSYEWSYPGALLFSVTVITTIGYGHIAPKTKWGRIVCIVYATLGIPLMLLCLANIGDVMADIFRFIYIRLCCCGCCRERKKKPERSSSSRNHEVWKIEYEAQQGLVGRPAEVVEDTEDDEDDDDDDKISVPLTITISVIASYILFGALLFGILEKWDSLEASYFCFITISTIGFGDIVPGSATFETESDQYKMLGAACYMMFGMAILSMCFSLIQEEIVAKFKYVAERLGILDKNGFRDDEEDAEDEVRGRSRASEAPRMRMAMQRAPMGGAGRQRSLSPAPRRPRREEDDRRPSIIPS